MKIKDITLKNFMKYDAITCSFDESVTFLVGKNGQGKSELGFYGVQAILQGIAEKATAGTTPLFGERFRFIGQKGPTSMNQLTLIDEKRNNAEIVVRRKITKTGSELTITGPEDYGEALDQAWLNNLFNIFLISPKQFQMLSSKEQANALGIDTLPFDKAIADLKTKHTAISQAISAIGKLEDLEETKEVDVKALQAEKETIRQQMAKIYRENQATNKATREAWEASKRNTDKNVTEQNDRIERDEKDRALIIQARAQIANICISLSGLSDFVDYSKLSSLIENWEPLDPKLKAEDLYDPEPTNLAEQAEDYVPQEDEKVYIREMPDDTSLKAIDQKIADASETNRKALLYAQYSEKKTARDTKEAELAENKRLQQVEVDKRLEYIKNFKFPYKNITVGEDGELLLDGRPLKEPHFSTGEMLKIIPILISTSNPELKYVFLQDFNLMDEDKQQEVEEFLTAKGFQLVIEYVGKKKIEDKNCILLKDNLIVENYDEITQPALSL